MSVIATSLLGLVCSWVLLLPSYSRMQEDSYFVKEGNLMIGFIDTLPSMTGGNVKAHQMQNIITFQYTIEKYANSLLDGEIDIGYVMFLTTEEDCVNDVLYILNAHPNLVAFIGPRTSYLVLSLSSLLSSLRIPTFVYGSSVLGDYILESLDWKYVLPMTATATGQANTAIPRIVSETGANIVTVVFDDTDYARPQLPLLLKSLKSHGIDIKQHILLVDKKTDVKTLEGVVDDLREAIAANRTLVLVTLVHSSRIDNILNAVIREVNDAEFSILVVTSSAGCVLTVNSTWSEMGINVIKLCQLHHTEPELNNYITHTALFWLHDGQELNTMLRNMVVNVGKCTVGDNACFRKLLLLNLASGRPYSAYNHRIYYALRSLLDALSNPELDETKLRAQSHKINGLLPLDSKFSEQLLELFKGESNKFPFGLNFGNERTSRHTPFLNIAVHFNDEEAVEWREEGNSTQLKEHIISQLSKEVRKRLKCSLPCDPGSYIFRDPLQLATNCWDCATCQGNKYSDTVNAPLCTECTNNTWTNRERTSCSVLPSSLHLTQHPLGVVVLIAILFSLAIISLTFGLYVCLWHSQVVVASGRDLAILMFPGMLCGMLDAALIASTPGTEVCEAVQILSHLLVMFILPSLVVRTLRILVVFNFSVSRKCLVRYVTKGYVYVLMTAVVIPVLLSLLIGLIIPEYRFTKQITVEDYLKETFKVTASCTPQDFSLVYFLIGYVLTFLLAATFMGFKTRKLPENYKESMHIFMCSLITLALVMSYVPAMILIPGEKQVFSLALIVAILSLTVNTTIFLPKIYVLIQYPELRGRKPICKKMPTTNSLANSHCLSNLQSHIVIQCR